MSISQKQTLEIVKVLYRGADILILDEPTSVLTPQETEKLFGVIRRMRDHGHAIVIITHKLHEVLAVSDRVAILRKGEFVGSIKTSEATELSLTEMMVGHKVELQIERPTPVNPIKRLEVRNLTVVNPDGLKALDNVSTFTAAKYLVLQIAGCGQELLKQSQGFRRSLAVNIYYAPGEEHVESSYRQIIRN